MMTAKAAATLSTCIAASLALIGCGGYGDFTLPAPSGGAAAGNWSWQAEKGPVLGQGDPGAWDAVDALNPSVVAWGGQWLNLYSGFDGRTWHTGLATSADAIAWSRQGRVLSPDPGTWEGGYIAANGTALARGGELLYWYHAGAMDRPRIGLARSRDGRTWTRHPAPVLEWGPRGSWDERGVADPYVIEAGGALYLIYLGQDRARRQRLGIARSFDGIVWTKLRSNPVLDLGPDGAFDENGLGEAALWTSHGRWWMLYTGRDRFENRRMGLAESGDGVAWRRSSLVIAGTESWNSKVVCDPSVVLAPGGEVRVWFGGGDVAHPAERIHGHIGAGRLTYR
ncbi:MAG: hypothetical protein FJW40_02150 [Acidobacteria bacterium]|nr:hypothetical protein [Acidobacteriota bacterium]